MKYKVGTAGWSYSDWNSVVYPSVKKNFDKLVYLSKFFNVIEINSTFYRIPEPETVRNWTGRVEERKNFEFTVKINQMFTHEREYTPEKIRAFSKTLEIVKDADILGAVLIQFPPSFHCCEEERDYLYNLLENFVDFPVVVEFRHKSWLNEEILKEFEENDISFCNIDQPEIGKTMPPTSIATSSRVYFRLHGRNKAKWFEESAESHERYDYLYNPGEIDSWIDMIKSIDNTAGKTYIILNNHFRGKAPANALQLVSKLKNQKVKVPEKLFDTYPELEDIASNTPDQQTLF